MQPMSIDPKLTLGDAIRQLRVEAGEVDMAEAMSVESAKAFDMHDAVHIVFGCDESLPGEISAHVWMALATTAPLSEMHKAVASREHKSVLSGFGHMKLLGTWVAMLPRIIRIFWRARRMNRRLPYEHLSVLMHTSVAEIRADYRIKHSG